MALIDIKVPDIGDFSEVSVIELLVKPGDTIKAEQSLITVDSDKASMEIPSSHAGVVQALAVKLGDKVAEGSVVLSLEVADGAAVAPAAPAAHSTPDITIPDEAVEVTPVPLPAQLQPQPGPFDFSRLDRIMAMLHEAGIRVNLGTGTASPPPWTRSASPTAPSTIRISCPAVSSSVSLWLVLWLRSQVCCC